MIFERLIIIALGLITFAALVKVLHIIKFV